MEKLYEIECAVCDIVTHVEVKYEDERPAHCPMCGEDASPVALNDEE